MSRYEHPLTPEKQDELTACLDGALEEAMIPEATRHLETCVDCGRMAADTRRLSLAMTQWEVEDAPPSLTAHMNAEIERVKGTVSSTAAKTPWWRRQRTWTLGFYGVSGGFAVIVFFLFIFPGGPQTKTAELSAEYANAIQDLSANRFRAADGKAAMPAAPMEGAGQQGQGRGGQGGGGRLEKRAQVMLQRQEPKSELESAADGAMIVHTVQLNIVAKDFDRARTELDASVLDSRGYVEQMRISGGKGSARALSATLRIPADRLEPSLTALRRIGQVQDESRSATDVSTQHVDLTARLKNARNTEQRLLTMLRERTGVLKDVVEAEREVARVREEIEQMDAQLQGLSKKVALASVHVELSEEFRAKLNEEPRLPSTGTRLRNAAINGYHLVSEALLNILLFILMYGPTLALLAIAVSLAALVAWRLQKRFVVKQS